MGRSAIEQDKSHGIHLLSGAAETVPSDFGDPFPPLPTSFLAIAPTAGGKSMVLLNLVLRFYRGKFHKIVLFCPSANLDPQFKHLHDFLKRQYPDQNDLVFEEPNPAKMEEILTTQRKTVEYCRKHKQSPPQLFVIYDDLADRGDLMRGHSWLLTLATRGRHMCTTWWVSAQAFRLVGPPVRKNARCMVIFRLTNHKEVESLCEELSGIYTPREVMAIYDQATTNAPFSFLFVRLDMVSKDRNNVFWQNFEGRLRPVDIEESDEDGHRLADRPGALPAGLQGRVPGPGAAKGKARAVQDAGARHKAAART